jgi:hypothetical protein
MGALDRLNQRQNGSGEAASSNRKASRPPSTRSKNRCSRACSSASTPRPQPP